MQRIFSLVKSIVKELTPKRFLIRRFLRNVKESALVHKYLDGLNGIEIGASFGNTYGLSNTEGAYANVDFQAKHAQRWQSQSLPDATVNIVAFGDDLPFKDCALDYVFSSHVIEHFFDPVAAIKEWLRVVKTDGVIFMIVPHKERTFDHNRPITPIEEIMDRHDKKIQIKDYIFLNSEIEYNQSVHTVHDYSANFQMLSNLTNIDKKNASENYSQLQEDDYHHWTVWTYESFLSMCNVYNFNVIDSGATDDKIGNGFWIVLQK